MNNKKSTVFQLCFLRRNGAPSQAPPPYVISNRSDAAIQESFKQTRCEIPRHCERSEAIQESFKQTRCEIPLFLKRGGPVGLGVLFFGKRYSKIKNHED